MGCCVVALVVSVTTIPPSIVANAAQDYYNYLFDFDALFLHSLIVAHSYVSLLSLCSKNVVVN